VSRAPAVFVAAALTSSGCLYTAQIGRDRPGHVDLVAPPAVLPARGTLPAEPVRGPAMIVSGGVLADVGTRLVDGSTRGEAALAFELGLYFTHATPPAVILADDRNGYRLGPWQLGVNVGWTPAATRSSTPAVAPPSMFVEAQGRYEWCGLAAGVAVTPGDARDARTGFQLAELLGPLYLRQQLLLDGSFVVALGLALKAPIVLAF
jgi:hypothetical protein